MRAWLLLLAVLATFQPIVQVASTEDISSRFITAISPPTETRAQSDALEFAAATAQPATTSDIVPQSTTALSTAFSAALDIASLSTTSSTSSTSAMTTSAKSPVSLQQPMSALATSSAASATSSSSTAAAATFLYKNSDSDKSTDSKTDTNDSRDNNNNIIIEIKNIKVIESDKVNDSEPHLAADTVRTQTPVQVPKYSEASATQLQLDNSKNNQTPTTTTTHNNQFFSTKHTQLVDYTVAQVSEAMAVQESVNKTPKTTATTTTTPTTGEDVKKHRHHHHQHQHHQKHQTPSSHAHPTTTSAPSSTSSTSATAAEAPVPAAPSLSPSVDAIVAQADDELAVDSALTSHDPSPADDVATEPATYSNKEIISEKVKPDPSTLVEIENSLLSLFNMKRPPKIDRSKIIIPEAMKQLYAQIMGHELDSVNIPKPGLLTKSANTVRSFTHQDSKIDDRFPHHHRFRLHFDIKSIPADEKLKAAELQLTRDAISHAALNARLANRTRYQVLVYDITRVGVRGKREPSYLLLDNKTIRLNSTEPVSLDVQPAVDRWLATPNRNYGLLVEVRTMRSLKPAPHRHVRLRRSADEPHDSWQRKQPLLFTYTDDGRHKSRSIRDVSTRSKRAGHHRRPHRRKNNDEICRRHSLYVDFADVGWSDWIVAPPGYDAFYCHGKCPFPLAEHLNSTNHAVVQTLVNNINPAKVPKACCVPTQLEGISMLYLNDQSTVVLKNYQDMTVVGCGCR